MTIHRITHVALQHKGKTYALPAPNRHHDLFAPVVEPLTGSILQGFLDDRGKFLSPLRALSAALKAGQVTEDSISARAGQLFSEDLW